VILLYQIAPTPGLSEIVPSPATDPFAASNASSGEPVGLAVLPD
jgi:hypothetical protein